MDKWTEFRTAYQVALLGTVSAAADALKVHRATVNRHIDVLEDEIGARIFIRHTRGYTLTEVGEDLLRVASQTEALINDLAGRVRGRSEQLSGEVRLTTLPPLARLLMPAIAAFRQQNPLCSVTLLGSTELARLEYGEAHIALRAGPEPTQPDYVVQKFEPIRFALYAHDDYVKEHGVPTRFAEFSKHRFIAPGEEIAESACARWIEQNIPLENIVLFTNPVWMTLDAVLAGVGIGFLTEDDVRGRRDIHEIMPHQEDWSAPLWLVTHGDLHRSEKVQALLNCIKDEDQWRR